MTPAGEINNNRNTCKMEYIFARLASSIELATADSKYGLAMSTPAADKIKLIMIGVKLLPFVMIKMEWSYYLLLFISCSTFPKFC